jgi:hypothetical protein
LTAKGGDFPILAAVSPKQVWFNTTVADSITVADSMDDRFARKRGKAERRSVLDGI